MLVGGVVRAAGPEDAAQAAADSWLRIVDGGDYAAAWSQAARVLKSAVKQGDWAQAVGGARGALGGVASRRVKSRELTTRMPSTRTIGGNVYTLAGEGQYVVLQYESAFANRPSAAETVIAMADADGAWRVAGYSVR
jgi:hypothetical protein